MSDFWQDDTSIVLANGRDDRAVREAEAIRPWLNDCKDLAGHVLFATSGSTGGSKWVALSKEALLVSARAVNEHLKVSSDDRWMLSLPTFHVGGLGVCARVYVARCGISVYEGKWDAERFCSQLEADQTTLVSLVPTQLVDIVRTGLPCPPSLRGVLIGGGRLEDEVYESAVQLGWPVIETYGMTETASQVATAQVGDRVMKLLPIWQAKLNEAGNLMLKGKAMMSGYVKFKERGICFSIPQADGWFQTKDLVDLVELDHGRVSFLGRADRCVKVLGELVDLDRVTHELCDHLKSKAETYVVALEDDRVGAVLVACSMGGGRVSLDSYNSQCHPLHRIQSWYHVDEIPKSPLGKVMYGRLGEMLTRLTKDN